MGVGWGSVAFFRERLAAAEGVGSSSSMGKGTLSEGVWRPFLDFFMGGGGE